MGMESHEPRDPLRYIQDLKDPRPRHNIMHRFSDILAIALLGMLGGAKGWSDFARYGQSHEAWLRTFLALPYGIPSADTFSRVIGALEPTQFELVLQTWTQALADPDTPRERTIAVDGKTVRQSFDRAGKKAAIHMISAWCDHNRMTIGQLAIDDKSNEITALPKLLAMLDIKGATVTADAMHCQKATAEQIIKAGGDYLLQVKGNQKTVYEEVKLFMDDAIEHRFEHMAHAKAQEVDAGHGRIETRVCYSTNDIAWFRDRKEWTGLRSFVCVESVREIGDRQSRERRYYLSSRDGRDAQGLLHATRSHWGVENPLHWCLDVTYQEDACRIRKDHGAENFSRLRRISMNLVRRHQRHLKEQGKKESLRGILMRCGWSPDYLLKILCPTESESLGMP